MSTDYRYPINPRTEPHPERYKPLRDQNRQLVKDESGETVLDLDSPIHSRQFCHTCGQQKDDRYFSTFSSLAASVGPCIDCSRAWFEELTAPAVTGSRGKDDAWKVANLHLYYEHFYRKRTEALGAPVVIRSFTVQELLHTHGKGRNTCYVDGCFHPWSDLRYFMAPEDGGSHSLENVRPVCQEHIS